MMIMFFLNKGMISTRGGVEFKGGGVTLKFPMTTLR